MLMTACASPSPACSARHGKGAGFIGSGTPWRTCPRGSTLWSPRRSARPFLQTDAEAAHQTWRHVADQLRARWPKLATLMDDSEHDVLAYMTFPAQHRTKLHSTNPLERLKQRGQATGRRRRHLPQRG